MLDVAYRIDGDPSVYHIDAKSIYINAYNVMIITLLDGTIKHLPARMVGIKIHE